MLANGDFPFEDGDDLHYEDVEVGKQDNSELDDAIMAMIGRASKNLPNYYHSALEDLVLEITYILLI